MAKKKAAESFKESQIEFELEHVRYRLLRLNPKTMEVLLAATDEGTERTLPFAHLPRAVKQKIRPL